MAEIQYSIQHSFQRYEKKFILTPEQYREILPDLLKRMDEEIYGLHTVCNIYYDTPSYELIRTSIDAPVYKEKFRLRSYGVPESQDYIYAEIKKKYAGIVYKRRVEGHPGEIQEFLDRKRAFSHDRQIQGEILWFLQSYQPTPKVFIGYERKAFLGRQDKDLRITFDWNIRWRNEALDLMWGDEGEPVLPEERIVMEVKIAQAMPLWLSRLLSTHQIYPTSFSKYGTCYQRHIAASFAGLSHCAVNAKENLISKNGGEKYVEQYYDRSDHSAAAAYLPDNSDGARCADRHSVFV
ncbi:MAG: polyphosphate polymerase domain-containing protein [Lachnospiraceae bacterium]|nr:polyphosphate polymerase domain-containing protein [Lachnospiraceae bacterium]